MDTKKVLPIPHGMFDGLQGQNYEIDGAISFALEALGEPAYDYWFVAGLTGDSFSPIYYRDHWRGNSAAEVRCSDGDISPVLETFALCGYDCDFVPAQALCLDRESHLRRILRSIDDGIPVIRYFDGWQVVVGYADGGRALLAIWGDRWGDTWVTPARIEADRFFALPEDQTCPDKCPNPGCFFPGPKRAQVDLAGLYRKAILRLPALLSAVNENYCFGGAAFRAWADEIEGGRYDGMSATDFEANKWFLYTNYLCVLASNGTGYRHFLDKAFSLNPDMEILPWMGMLLGRMGQIWEGKGGSPLHTNGDPVLPASVPLPLRELLNTSGDGAHSVSLEQLGGGFNVSLETLQSPEKRTAIAARLRECAALSDALAALIAAR